MPKVCHVKVTYYYDVTLCHAYVTLCHDVLLLNMYEYIIINVINNIILFTLAYAYINMNFLSAHFELSVFSIIFK